MAERFNLMTFVEVPCRKLGDFLMFLKHSNSVNEVKGIEIANEIFPSRFNLMFYSEHISDVEAIRFQKDVKKAFSLSKTVCFETLKNTA